MNMSIGESKFDGLNIGVRRRMNKGIQLNAWYPLVERPAASAASASTS